jgi:hypothetical protein
MSEERVEVRVVYRLRHIKFESSKDHHNVHVAKMFLISKWIERVRAVIITSPVIEGGCKKGGGKTC